MYACLFVDVRIIRRGFVVFIPLCVCISWGVVFTDKSGSCSIPFSWAEYRMEFLILRVLVLHLVLKSTLQVCAENLTEIRQFLGLPNSEKINSDTSWQPMSLVIRDDLPVRSNIQTTNQIIYCKKQIINHC